MFYYGNNETKILLNIPIPESQKRHLGIKAGNNHIIYP
jgi:hypothetical protein